MTCDIRILGIYLYHNDDVFWMNNFTLVNCLLDQMTLQPPIYINIYKKAVLYQCTLKLLIGISWILLK